MGAIPAVAGDIQVLLGYLHAETVGQLPFHRLAHVIHAGFLRHFALGQLFRHVVAFPVLDEHRSRLNKAECNVMGHTLGPKIFHPIKVAGPCPIVILPAAYNLLDLPISQVLFNADRAVCFHHGVYQRVAAITLDHVSGRQPRSYHKPYSPALCRSQAGTLRSLSRADTAVRQLFAGAERCFRLGASFRLPIILSF